MAPERAGHSLRKAAARDRTVPGVRAAGLPCQVFPDGITIEVGDSDYDPDAVLRCGPRLANDAVAIPDPMVIVEVLSPGTARSTGDTSSGVFPRSSLRHYLIVWPDIQRVVHHRMTPGGELATICAPEGEIRLDPPGISISLVALYAD